MIRKSLMIIALFLAALNVAAEIPPETVLVEFDDGDITMEYFNQRLEKIPPMYQARYQTYDGKVKFLDDLVTEEVFYKKALEMNLDESENVLQKLENQIKASVYQRYKEQLNNEMSFSDEELHEYFLDNLDDYPGITFEEARTMVENAYRREQSESYFENIDNELMSKYDININEELLSQVDFNDMSTIEPIKDEKYITSSSKEFEKTIGELKHFYDELPNQNKRPFLRLESLLNSVKELVKTELYYLKAIEDGFDVQAVRQEIEDSLKRTLILREAFNRLVTDRLEISEETIHEYYQENIDKFSTKAYRKIQAFAFADEKTADKFRKKAKKALKKNNEELLNEVLEESLFEFENGEINYIYKNYLIPKCGRDTLWNNLVWETPAGKTDPKKLSDVFLSAEGKYVFFRILEDNLAVPTPYEEARVKIENEKRKENSRQFFMQTNEELRQEFAVKIYNDRLIDILSPEEYFQKAEEAQKKRKYKDAVYFYDQLCKFYPDSDDSYKALFMKGFIYSEELKNEEKAIEIFQQVISDYPQGELHESAEFMIKELKGESNILEKMK